VPEDGSMDSKMRTRSSKQAPSLEFELCIGSNGGKAVELKFIKILVCTAIKLPNFDGSQFN